MSCFSLTNFELPNVRVNLREERVNRIITNFLRKSSKGNIIGIRSIKYKRDTVWEIGQPFKVELILECHCRDGLGFPNMNNLANNMYAVLRPILKDFSEVKLEYHYSMYYSRD